jgi:hypothetical protein
MRTQPNIDRLILDIHAAPPEPERWQYVVDTSRYTGVVIDLTHYRT